MTVDLIRLFDSVDITNSKLQKVLITAISENSTAEFDYLKFKISIKKMMDMGMDKSTAIQSAFTTASVMGVSKELLLSSARKYKSALDKEKEKFAGTLKRNIAKNVDGQQVQVDKLKKAIISHKEKIAQLLKEIETYEEKINNVDEVVANAKAKIEKTRNDFRSTFDAIYSQIDEDIASIETTI